MMDIILNNWHGINDMDDLILMTLAIGSLGYLFLIIIGVVKV